MFTTKFNFISEKFSFQSRKTKVLPAYRTRRIYIRITFITWDQLRRPQPFFSFIILRRSHWKRESKDTKCKKNTCDNANKVCMYIYTPDLHTYAISSCLELEKNKK